MILIKAIKLHILIISALTCLNLAAQDKDSTLRKTSSSYDRKEEILYDNKRYRKYNNYLSGGAGFLASTLRVQVQKAVGVDFQFHVRRQYFQTGLLMSGEEFLSNNHIGFHACYGIREEKNRTNVTIFGGPSVFTGVEGTPGLTPPSYYQGLGAYFCFQSIIKIKYDIGLGIDVFAELSEKQKLGGLKFIFFFSGSYRGLKGNYNPHVKSENRR